MRVLLATDRCFLPPTDGSTRVYDAWLHALTALGARVSLLSFNHRRTRWSVDSAAAARERAAELVVVPFVSGSAEAVARRGCEQLHQMGTGRRHLPAALGQPWSAAARRSLTALLSERRWDWVIVQKVDTAGMIGAAALRGLGARLAVDLHDNLPLRQSLTRATARRAVAERTGCLLRALRPEEIADALLPPRLARALADEASLLAGFDHVLFAAPAERRAYQAAGLDPACCRDWLWGFDPADVAEPPDGTRPPFDLGFIGGANAFNMEALAFLARAILPRLQRLIGRPPTVLLAGSSAQAMRPLFACRPEVVVEPWVDDLGSFYRRVGVVAVPLLSGTGVSIKTLEAARFGAAIVSTSVGLRGVALDPGREVELADDPDAFAAAVTALVADPARRHALGRGSRVASEASHSLRAFTRQVGALLGAGSKKTLPGDRERIARSPRHRISMKDR